MVWYKCHIFELSNNNIMDINSDYVGRECFWVDKVTRSKKYDGKPLGKCIEEGVNSVNKLPILWFDKPFLFTSWQYKSDVRLIK